MGLPPLAKSARVDAKADGSFENPRVAGDASVQGISAGGRKLPELVAKFGLERGTLRLDKLSGPVFGGHIDGHGHRAAVGEAREQAAAVADRRHEAGPARHRPRRCWRSSEDLGGPAVAARRRARAARRPGRARHRPRGHAGDAARRRLFARAGRGRCSRHADKTGQEARQGGRRRRSRRCTSNARRAAPSTFSGKVALAHQDLDLDVVLDRLPLAGLPGVADVRRARSAASPARSCTSAAAPKAPS